MKLSKDFLTIIGLVILIATGIVVALVLAFGYIRPGGSDIIGPPVVEEQGILLIKNTPEYAALVNAYGSGQVSVKAINLHQSNEASFLKKISPGFQEQPGCIIVMEGGNREGYVYQLDEEFSIVHRTSLSEFIEGSKSVDAQTMDNFYASLK